MLTKLLSRVDRTPPLVASLKLFVVAICLSITLVTCGYEYITRDGVLAKAAIHARIIAGSLAQHAADTFESVDVLLTTLSDRLQAVSRTPDEMSALGEGLASQLRQVTRIRSIMAYDRTGRPFVSSQLGGPDRFDLSSNEAFHYHRSNPGMDLRIGNPVKSPTDDDFVIPISRRLNDLNGAFEGVLFATVDVTYFTDFYQSLGMARDANISLIEDNGYLLSRSPLIEANMSQSYSSVPWFNDILSHKEGSFRLRSEADGIDRVQGYHAVGRYPVTIVVGFSQASVLANWLRGCVLNVAAAVVLTVVVAVFGMKLARQFEIRHRSEHGLRELARTDGLTGLKNRRAFDEALAAEWAAARIDGKTLSLMLLDVDHFKSFNDTYGHLAGDDCLRALSGAIGKAVYRPGDHVARYGGEEFVILLPDTDEADAIVVAERVRCAVLALAIPHAGSVTNAVVSVSVGVATYDAALGNRDQASTLVADADRALYKAKYLGRNRVECLGLTLVNAEQASRATALTA